MSGSSCGAIVKSGWPASTDWPCGQRGERDPAVLRRADDLLGVHLALHAQAVQLAARALPVLDHAGEAGVDEAALGLARLDVALDARRRAARAGEPALLRAHLVALLRRLLARQVALGRRRGDVVALRDQAGEQPLARADVGAQGLALLAQAVQAALEHEAVDRGLLARRIDLALDRRLLGLERLAHRCSLAAAFLAQPLAADDGEQIALPDDRAVAHRQPGDAPVERRLQADQAAARVDEGGDAVHRRVLDDGDEGDQRGEEREGDRGERGDAAPVRRQCRADLRARGGLDGHLPEQRRRRSVHAASRPAGRMKPGTDSRAFRAHVERRDRRRPARPRRPLLRRRALAAV